MTTNKFSLQVFIVEILSTLGQGEWQDSLFIGLLSYLGQQENYMCKLCKQSLRQNWESSSESDHKGQVI